MRGQAAEIGRRTRIGRRPQRAGLPGLTAKLIALDEPEQRFGGGVGETNHVAAEFAEILLDLVRIRFEAGIDVAAIAARGAPAGLMRLQQEHVDAALREVECGGEAGDPAADDGDARACLTREPGEVQRGDCRLRIKAERQRLLSIARHDATSP